MASGVAVGFAHFQRRKARWNGDVADLFAYKFFELLPLFVSNALRESVEGDAAFVDPVLQLALES